MSSPGRGKDDYDARNTSQVFLPTNESSKSFMKTTHGPGAFNVLSGRKELEPVLDDSSIELSVKRPTSMQNGTTLEKSLGLR